VPSSVHTGDKSEVSATRDDPSMAAIDRRVDRGTRLGRLLCRDLAEELRRARIEAGLSQEELGRLAGMAHASVGRIERDERESIGIVELARLFALVGHRLYARNYPETTPRRDSAHAALLERLHARLHPSVSWRTEVPLPNPGDLRAWDALLRVNRCRVGVEAETRPRDGQALQRRISLKRRDGGVDRVLLVVADTRTNHSFLREHGVELRTDFPQPGRDALAALAAGTPPGDAIILL
jgi:transcriptional regulator with XRE-family HTH domain